MLLVISFRSKALLFAHQSRYGRGGRCNPTSVVGRVSMRGNLCGSGDLLHEPDRRCEDTNAAAGTARARSKSVCGPIECTFADRPSGRLAWPPARARSLLLMAIFERVCSIWSLCVREGSSSCRPCFTQCQVFAGAPARCKTSNELLMALWYPQR